MTIFSSSSNKLQDITGSKNLFRRPDFRNLVIPRLSGMPLDNNEIDYDELVIHRTWRSYEQTKPDEVRYFMFELSQKNPGETLFSPTFFKAIRMIRLTRVPRYLRQSSSQAGPNMVFEQMRDVLAALREQGSLFINLVAKSPQLPLIFAYGVQGVGSTQEEAQRMADEAFAVLDFQLSGTYQQLMYKPISVAEGELISRYQSEWQHLAMGRGRPLPTGGTLGTASLLDGNRSDVESSNNQLESFIRGMSDKSFVLSLVTVPLSPAEIAFSWRNLTQKLSEVKSEINGQRAVSAGVAFPLVMGTSDGNNAGATHTAGTNSGINQSTGINDSNTQGTSRADGVSQSFTAGTNSSTADGVNHSTTLGTNNSTTQGTSSTVTDGTSRSTSLATGTTASHGVTQTTGTSASTAQSVNDSWNTSTGQSLSNSQTNTSGNSTSQGTSSSQTIGQSDVTGTAASAGSTSSSGNNVSGGVLGTGGGTNSSSGTTATNSNNASHTTSISQTGGSSTDNTVSQSIANGVTTGTSNTQGVGGGTSTTQTTGTNASTSISDTTGTNRTSTTADTTSRSVAIGTSNSSTQGTSTAETNGTSRTNTVGISSANQSGTNATNSTSNANTSGTSSSNGSNSGVSDAWAMAYSRSFASSGSLAVAPSFGVSVSRQTFDAAKDSIGNMLDAQLRRYNEGLKSGAFLYQMFLVCPDRETLVGGAGLLKSAFWGAGESSDQLPQPFHTITNFKSDEKDRLLSHAVAFTSYRKREEVIELIEPFKYSSYLTPTEAAAFTHPPVVEGPGLLAVHDSMPVMRMPMDRQHSEIQLGHIVNGERGIVSDIKFGISIEDLKGHALIAGVTGSGKTTTLMKLLSDAVKIERQIVDIPTIERPYAVNRTVRASVLGLDWMRNMRNLASMPELVNSGRFKFYSLMKPELGEFRWNPLEVPAQGMTTYEWLNAQADNFTSSFNLGEFGRSLIAEYLTILYSVNRLEPYSIIDEVVDPLTGAVLRQGLVLPAIPEDQFPLSAFTYQNGKKVVNAFTFTDLSRCVSIGHLAALVMVKIEEAATPEGAKLGGMQMRERLQSLWRRIQYFEPNGQYGKMLGHDVDLKNRTCISVTDLIDPDRGLVTVLETDGLDFGARRLVLGSVLLAIYRYGLHHGDGIFDHNGKGPGCFVVMEESHELFGDAGSGEDAFSAETRTALYEGMFRRVRALGLRLIPVAQQPSTLPEAVTANVNTVFIHKVRADEDRQKVFSLLNWSNQIGQQMREYRYIGELPTGYCIARMDAKEDYTESAPVQFKTEPPVLNNVSDQFLKNLL
jgi:hypothetical protein